ncbi:MAG: VRR-NUC domain-containing protein [Pseudomonadales bacterium]
MPQLAANQPPPADYYAANLRTLVGHVLTAHSDLLSAPEHRYLRALQLATVPAQRLYARLLSRSRPWVRIDKLRYAEIADPDEAIAELQAAGLVRVNGAAPADVLLGLLTQAERARLFPQLPRATKAVWIRACVARCADTRIRSVIAGQYPWIGIADFAHIKLCQLLFFGSEQQDTSTFVLQDLGVLQFESYSLDPGLRMFSDRASLERYLSLRRLRLLTHRVEEVAGLDRWLSRALWAPAHNRLEVRHRDRALYRLGYRYEREGALDEALCCYGRARLPPARERRVRILERLGDETGVAALLARIADSPRAAEEEDFVHRRQAGSTARGRHRIEQMRIPLQGQGDRSIEDHAAGLLSASGGLVWHLENQFPLGLAGLAYWTVVFAPVAGAFVNPFQFGPLDLMSEDFCRVRQDELALRQAQLDAPGGLRDVLTRTYRSKAGIANRLVNWSSFDASVLQAVIDCLPHSQLLDLARYVIANLNRARRGFPDLLVIYGPGQFEFVEVKGPTDQLQPGQRIWFETLDRLGLPARVLKFHL